MTTCLSEFALDQLLLDDEASPEVRAHVGACAACQRRRQQHRSFEEEFERTLAIPFWRAVVRGHRRRRLRRFVWLGVPPTVAATCALAFFVTRHDGREPAAQLLAKGSATLEIHCRRGARTFTMAPGEPVQAGDELRFVPRSPSSQARYIQVASIDGTGTYTPFYPSEPGASSLPLPPAGQPLPGSIRLDRAPGPERLFFVFSATPLSVAAVRQAAQAHVATLNAMDTIEGAGVASSWIVLPKNIPMLR